MQAILSVIVINLATQVLFIFTAGIESKHIENIILGVVFNKIAGEHQNAKHSGRKCRSGFLLNIEKFIMCCSKVW